MDQSLVHTVSCENSYGPMVLKVFLKFPPALVLIHGWAPPSEKNGKEVRVLKGAVPQLVGISAPKKNI